MTKFVKILEGVLSNGEKVDGMVFPAVSDLLDNNSRIGGKLYTSRVGVDTTMSAVSIQRAKARVNLPNQSSAVFFEQDSSPAAIAAANGLPPSAPPEKTDGELLEEIRGKFHTLKVLSEAATKGKIRSMIVSGSPGTGKTHEVMAAIGREEARNPMFYSSVIKGTISPVALYIELFNARDGILVLDDSDSAFEDNEALQLLKAATESNANRHISYRKMSSVLENAGIPNSFIFKGCVIVLTNTDLEDARKSKAPHYDALISRSHFISAVLKTNREKILRIKSIVEDTDILDNILPDKSTHAEVVDFIDRFSGDFRELSIRTVVKLAELRGAFDADWQVIARTTLLKNR